MGWFNNTPQTMPSVPDKSDADSKSPGVDNESLLKAMSLMEEGLKKINLMQEQIDALAKEKRDQFPPPEDPYANAPKQPETKHNPRLADLSEEEVESLSRKDYLSRLQSELLDDVTTSLKEALKPVTDQISTVQQQTVQEKVYNELQRFRSAKDESGNLKYPDFEDWKNEMQKLNSRTQGLSLEQLYSLAKNEAKMQDPDKYKRVTEKYWPEPKPTTARKLPFGGVPPKLIGEGPPKGNLSVREAAAKALGNMLETEGPIPVGPPDVDLPS